MAMTLSKLQEMVKDREAWSAALREMQKDREAWSAAVHGVAKSDTT